MSRASILAAGAVILGLMGPASIAQADQPGPRSPDAWRDHIADHHRERADEGWRHLGPEMMAEVHGTDGAELERHWKEMSEWMDGRGGSGFHAGEMNAMVREFHGPGYGPGMHDGLWGAGHCGAGSLPRA